MRTRLPRPSPSSKASLKSTTTPAKVRAPSLQQVYLRSCEGLGLHPNSDVVRLLPAESGTPYAGPTLDLSGNYVGDKGIAPILAVLEKMPKVTAVIFAENGLRNHAVELLCTSAAQLLQLEYIDLSDNCISDGAAAALMRLLEVNRHIREVVFDNTKIPVEWRVKLTDALEANRRGDAVGMSVSTTGQSPVHP